MRLATCAAALGCVTVLSGCVTNEPIRFATDGHQVAVTRDGRSALVSRGKGSIVRMMPVGRYAGDGNRATFYIGLRNISRRPIEFRIRNMTAAQVVGGQIASPLKIYSYESLLAEERAAQIGRMLFATAAAALNTAAASRRGYWAQRRAERQNEELLDAVQEVSEDNQASLEVASLKDETIFPGELYQRMLQIDRPDNSAGQPIAYEISLVIGSDRHIIRVVQGEEPKPAMAQVGPTGLGAFAQSGRDSNPPRDWLEAKWMLDGPPAESEIEILPPQSPRTCRDPQDQTSVFAIYCR